MPEWRMLVWEPDGTARATIDVDSAVASLDTMEVSGAGICREATFHADPQAVTIKARDVIRIDARESSGDAWTAVFKGIIVIAGSARAERLQDYKAVGLKQRFSELIIEDRKLFGADVATMVDAILTSITLPEGVTYDSADAPTQNFQLGERFPNVESVKDFLDALAAFVKRFVVPTGETYTYDGVTYNEGNIVPATEWGVDADGAFFFRRPQAAAVSASERDTQTLVEWDRANVEEVYDSVMLVYATDYADGWVYGPAVTNPSTKPEALYETHGTGVYESTRRVVLDAPVDYMKDDTQGAGVRSGSWNNVANAFDEDTSTYAWATASDSALEARYTTGTFNGILRLRFHVDAVRVIEVSLIDKNEFTGIGGLIGKYRIEASPGTVFDQYLPTLRVPVSIASHMLVVAQGFGTGDDVYKMQLLVPDSVAGAKLAKGYEVDPKSDASRVHLVGTLGSVSQTMNLTPDGEAQEKHTIRRIEYGITTDDGLVTTYYLDEEFDAELLSQKIVLERLAREATK